MFVKILNSLTIPASLPKRAKQFLQTSSSVPSMSYSENMAQGFDQAMISE
jgi:hypothetical protein